MSPEFVLSSVRGPVLWERTFISYGSSMFHANRGWHLSQLVLLGFIAHKKQLCFLHHGNLLTKHNKVVKTSINYSCPLSPPRYLWAICFVLASKYDSLSPDRAWFKQLKCYVLHGLRLAHQWLISISLVNCLK